MTSDAHKAPRSHGDGREAVGPGIAYLSVAEAALRLGVHRNTIESWYRFRGLPVVRVGNVVRIRDVDLDTWLAGAIVTTGGGDNGHETRSGSAVPTEQRRAMDRPREVPGRQGQTRHGQGPRRRDAADDGPPAGPDDLVFPGAIAAKPLDNGSGRAIVTDMNTTTATDPRANWTEKQWAAYHLLKAAIEAPRTVTFGKAPKGGWTDADKVPTK